MSPRFHVPHGSPKRLAILVAVFGLATLAFYLAGLKMIDRARGTVAADTAATATIQFRPGGADRSPSGGAVEPAWPDAQQVRRQITSEQNLQRTVRRLGLADDHASGGGPWTAAGICSAVAVIAAVDLVVIARRARH